MMATQSSGAGVRSETLCKTEETDKDETATLKLKLKKKETKKIQWTEDTVDNEGKIIIQKTNSLYLDEEWDFIVLKLCRTW